MADPGDPPAPAAALLTLAGAGSALAASPDPSELTLAVPPGGGFTPGGSDLTSLFAPPGGWPTTPTDLISATVGIPDTGRTATYTPSLHLPTDGTLLADNRAVDATRLGTCTTGPGNAYRLNAVARYPLGSGSLKTPPVAYQTVNVEYCQAPDGTVTVGRPDGTSGPTHAGRLLGIQKTGDNPINVIPPIGANSSWQLINESHLHQGSRIPGIGDRFYDLRMDVRIRPSG